MHAVDSLGFSSRVELGLHHEDFVRGGQVEPEAAGTYGDQHHADGGVLAEDAHGFVARVAGQAAVESDVGVGMVFERDFDEVEVRCPAGKYNTKRSCQ